MSTTTLTSSNNHDGPSKRARLLPSPASPLPKSSKVIGTHSGTFQADEALGVWLLRQTSTYRNAKVIRSRDPKILQDLDIVLDVGGIYNHNELRYDHHQRGYDETFDSGKVIRGEVQSPRCTKLSASGLIYRHYGKDVIQSYYPNLSKDNLDLVYLKMYDKFMESIDAVDTGVEIINVDGIELQYKDCTGLSSRVSRLNPRWNEVEQDDEEGDDIMADNHAASNTNHAEKKTKMKTPDPDARFELASAMCGEDFLMVLRAMVESDLPARSIVDTAVQSRKDTVDSSGEIISLDGGGLPWKQHLYDLERQYNIHPLIKFVLYPDQSGMWRVQAVSVEGKGFENRLSLPEEWRGVRDEDLAKISGIHGARFCHTAGFIGGNDTYEGALEMAREALKRK